jgi:hypothetical protein
MSDFELFVGYIGVLAMVAIVGWLVYRADPASRRHP